MPAVLGAAVLMLMWHNAWMARHGRELAAEMSAVGAAVTAGQRPMTALAVVVGLAVLREGSEVVLFLYGIVATGTSASALLLGGALGVAAGAAFTALTYYGLISIPARHIFTVTTVLIALLAAGMAAQAVQFLDAAGVIYVLGQRLWDSSAWLPQDGVIGRLLHTLVGYTDRPTELQLAAYLGTLAAMAALTWTVGRSPSPVRERTGSSLDRCAELRSRGLAAGCPISSVDCAWSLRKTAKATSGALSITLSSARAGPRGERLPCSQLRTVSTGTPMRAANSACVSLVRARTPRA